LYRLRPGRGLLLLDTRRWTRSRLRRRTLLTFHLRRALHLWSRRFRACGGTSGPAHAFALGLLSLLCPLRLFCYALGLSSLHALRPLPLRLLFSLFLLELARLLASVLVSLSGRRR
jgi:hypothetical protein